ncbi:MAG: hypothetical protein IJ397_05775 [Lachnospiraceae bacterium]|nr:hypothetical protein [Lachnospiraceae bacterium]
MSKLYEKLSSIIEYEPDKEEEIKTDKLCNNLRVTANVLRVVINLLGIATICCIFADIIWVFWVFMIFTVTSLVLFARYRKKSVFQITNLLNECEINKALTAYMVLAKYDKGEIKKAASLLTNVAFMLFYLGKRQEAKDVAAVIGKYCDTPDGNGGRISVLAMIAGYEKDLETVKNCISEMEALRAGKKTPYTTMAYEIISQYPLIIDAEERGDYAKALELLPIKEEYSTLKQVNINYRLHKIAAAAGMEEEATKHREYVVENGGDTFYKSELEDFN